MTKTRFIFFLLTIALAISLSNCFSSDMEEGDDILSTKKKAATTLIKASHNSLPAEVKFPKDNLSTKEKIELGRLLFYDPILSGDKDIACATCHHPDHGYSEFRDVSIGTSGKGLGFNRAFHPQSKIPIMKRNSQTVLNTAYNGIDIDHRYIPEQSPMFWDMRVESLEKQALQPILTFEEMRGPRYSKTEILEVIIERLKNLPEYVALFESAFPEAPEVTEDNLGKAIATFERSLVTPRSRIDQYLDGDSHAISKSEANGFAVFNRVGCGNCHNGPMFSDYKSHVLGVPAKDNLQAYDKGIDSTFAFRTASLRNLRFTAPYMHNGRFNTLKEVLEFYEDISKGTGLHPEVSPTRLDSLVGELNITAKDMGPIISFLNTLDNPNFDKTIPNSVPSGLEVGGNITN